MHTLQRKGQSRLDRTQEQRDRAFFRRQSAALADQQAMEQRKAISAKRNTERQQGAKEALAS